jgi:hypothetical protein
MCRSNRVCVIDNNIPQILSPKKNYTVDTQASAKVLNLHPVESPQYHFSTLCAEA